MPRSHTPNAQSRRLSRSQSVSRARPQRPRTPSGRLRGSSRGWVPQDELLRRSHVAVAKSFAAAATARTAASQASLSAAESRQGRVWDRYTPRPVRVPHGGTPEQPAADAAVPPVTAPPPLPTAPSPHAPHLAHAPAEVAPTARHHVPTPAPAPPTVQPQQWQAAQAALAMMGRTPGMSAPYRGNNDDVVSRAKAAAATAEAAARTARRVLQRTGPVRTGAPPLHPAAASPMLASPGPGAVSHAYASPRPHGQSTSPPPGAAETTHLHGVGRSSVASAGADGYEMQPTGTGPPSSVTCVSDDSGGVCGDRQNDFNPGPTAHRYHAPTDTVAHATDIQRQLQAMIDRKKQLLRKGTPTAGTGRGMGAATGAVPQW